MESGLVAVILSLTPGICAAASTAAVSGVVRDSLGVAQMGAIVQVLAAGSMSVATAFTDMYGRYRVGNLAPGKYQVKATAALFVPATRRNLQLATGMRATVNLTLSMLADPAAWLPAERRKPDEPGDDWTWTLRSAVNRPILRMVDDGSVAMVSPGGAEAPGGAAGTTRAHGSMTGGGGGFGNGGVHTVVALDRAAQDGSDMMLRAGVASDPALSGRSPSTELDAGYERHEGFAGESRVVVSYASHPEMRSAGDEAGNAAGMQMLRMASAEKMLFGDVADVEAGGTVYAVHTTGVAIAAEPFVRVTVHPGEVWAVRYRMATSRGVQGFDGLDSVEAELPVAALSGGRLCTEKGSHQEIGVSRKAGRGVVQATVYRDAIDRAVVAGSGTLGAADLQAGGGSSGAVADTASDSFALLGAGYTTRGMSVTVSEPVTASLWAALDYETGAAMAAPSAIAQRLPEVFAGLRAEAAQAATAALKGQVPRTGTRLRAAYRWQPRHLVTAVDPYNSDQAYLSFYVRQAVRWGNRLPPGLEATVDVTNLLAQGYQPLLSADGRTLYLAEAPRMVRGGLSFTF